MLPAIHEVSGNIFLFPKIASERMIVGSFNSCG